MRVISCNPRVLVLAPSGTDGPVEHVRPPTGMYFALDTFEFDTKLTIDVDPVNTAGGSGPENGCGKVWVCRDAKKICGAGIGPEVLRADSGERLWRSGLIGEALTAPDGFRWSFDLEGATSGWCFGSADAVARQWPTVDRMLFQDKKLLDIKHWIKRGGIEIGSGFSPGDVSVFLCPR